MSKSFSSLLGGIAMAANVCLLFTAVSYADKPSDRGGKGERSSYRLIQLPDEFGMTGRDGYAMAINNQNAVVGGIEGRAYYWQFDGQGDVSNVVPLAWPADESVTSTFSNSVTENGTVVGSGKRGLQRIPLVWIDPATINLPPLELPLLDTGATGEAFSGSGVATDINTNGLITGWLSDSDPDGYDYLVVWQINLDTNDPWFGSIQAGPFVITETQSGLLSPSVNDSGNVVATVGGALPVAWRWRVDFDGESNSLQVLESEVLLLDGEVHDINENNQTCGVYFRDVDGAAVAYIRDAAGPLLEMPDLVNNKRRGTRSYAASALNDGDDSGLGSVQVVGAGIVFDKRSDAVISDHDLMWQGADAMDVGAGTDFGGADLAFSFLEDVNNAGWILPYSAQTSNGSHRAVALMPIK